MPYVEKEELIEFVNQLYNATKSVGGGKVALDSTEVRKLIRAHKVAAERYVELQCKMAASQPGYLQSAMLVAAGYQVEFNDDSLLTMVNQYVEELHAEDHMSGISVMPDKTFLDKEPPERIAARNWWKESGKNEGICDSCRAHLQKGEGYMLDGRLVMLGKSKLNLGKEILCTNCFYQLRNEPRDPGDKSGDYTTFHV